MINISYMPILDILTTNVGKILSNFAAVHNSIRERYSEFNLTTNQLCYKAIQSIGINKKVFIYAENSPFYIKWFFALSATNNISIHVPVTTKEAPLASYMIKYKPDAIIVDETSKKTVEKIIQEKNLEIIMVDLEQKYLTIYNEEFKPLANLTVNDKDVATAFFTKGSEQQAPKLIAFSHDAIKQITKMNRVCLKLFVTDKIYTTFSFSHFFGLITVAMSAVQSGSCILYPPKFAEKEHLFEFFDQECLSSIFSLPIELNSLADNMQKKELNKIRKAYVTDGKIGTYLENFYKINDDLKLYEMYGCLEAGWTVCINREGDDYLFGTQGMVFPGLNTKLVSEDGSTECSIGAGRLAIKGAAMMSGYYDEIFDPRPQEVKEEKPLKKTFMPGTWFLTDDFVEIDAKGYFYYVNKISNKQAIDECLKERQRKGLDKKKNAASIETTITDSTIEDNPKIKKLISLLIQEQNPNINTPNFISVETTKSVNGICMSATINNLLIGYIQAIPFWGENSKTTHVCTIECCVIDKLRHKGIGTLLMKKILPELGKNGYSQIVNIVSTGNLAASAYLKNLGFCEKGKLTNFLKDNDIETTVTLFEKNVEFSSCN